MEEKKKERGPGMAPPKRMAFIIHEDGTVGCPAYHPYHDLFLGIIDELDEREFDGIPWIMPYKEQVWCG